MATITHVLNLSIACTRWLCIEAYEEQVKVWTGLTDLAASSLSTFCRLYCSSLESLYRPYRDGVHQGATQQVSRCCPTRWDRIDSLLSHCPLCSTLVYGAFVLLIVWIAISNSKSVYKLESDCNFNLNFRFNWVSDSSPNSTSKWVQGHECWFRFECMSADARSESYPILPWDLDCTVKVKLSAFKSQMLIKM